MILLDIAAPILLMVGLQRTNPANAALLNNFEIVATTAIAFFLFRERVSVRLFWAILLVTAASILLSFEGWESLRFEKGAFFVLGACLCWGLENNCTRKLSGKSSVQITIIKGCFSGLGSLLVALLLREPLPGLNWILCIVLLGFVAYGLSINFYIMAQSHLGAAKTSAFYSIAPFLGVAFSMVLGERPGVQFYLGLLVMVLATWLMIRDTLEVSPAEPQTE
jgi:drug/metabolite transporter (DMT)-like permease